MKALVTGASSGIGEIISYELDRRGYELILVATDKKNLDKVQKNCKNKSIIIECDLSKEENVFNLYEQVKKLNIDILVNNAGFGLFGDFVETDLNRELEMIDVNIKAVHILTKKFLEDFTKRDSGRILNVASSAGYMPGPRLATYYATKNYVLRLTQAIYQELKHAKSRVHISCLCPGPVNTNFNKVARGKFTIKGASKEYVGKYAVDKMFKNKLVIVPTFKMKLLIFFQRFVPEKILLKIVHKIQIRKSK